MAGVRKQPTKGGLYQAWFQDHTGQRTFLTASKKKEALQIAQRLEDEHRQVRLGYRPLPSTAEKHRTRPFAEATEEYLALGEAREGVAVGHGRRGTLTSAVSIWTGGEAGLGWRLWPISAESFPALRKNCVVCRLKPKPRRPWPTMRRHSPLFATGASSEASCLKTH